MTDTEKPIDKEQVTNMDALTQGESFPQVQQHSIDAFTDKAAKEAAEKVAQAPTVKLKKDGTPAKQRGRKAGVKVEGSGLRDPRMTPSPAALSTPVDSTAAATTISGILEQMQVMLISEDFRYEQIERENNVAAWRKTIDSYGGITISPVQELIISQASIILARVHKPKTQTKITLAKAWLSDKISNFKKRKEKAKEDKENALSDSREDAERKIDVREEESAKPKKSG